MSDSPWNVEVLLTGNWRGATSALLSNRRCEIIVDTGMPHEAHRLVEALEQRGISPSDVQTIVNTHIHIDHVLNNSLFPNSLIYATQESYDWCRALYSDLLDSENWDRLVLKYYPETHEYERAKDLMVTLRKLALRWWDPKRLGDRSRFRWLEKDSLPDGLNAMFTSGHVPGHASIIVPGKEQPVVVAGDALLTREHDENVLTMIPHKREQFQRDRERLLAMNARILPGHDQEFSTPLDGS
jgi:glyoxylase-like metal-dependent hydrolase (beta-lactamase superfamily II)